MPEILSYKREAGGSLFAKQEKLEAEQTVTLEKTTVICNKNLTVSFFAGQDFGGLRAGHGLKEYSASYVEVDGKEIRVFFTGAETVLVKSVSHGLEIKGLDLDGGKLTAAGNVTSLRYSSVVAPKSLLKKIFK